MLVNRISSSWVVARLNEITRISSAAVSPDNTKVYENTFYSILYADPVDVIAIIDTSTGGGVTTIPPVMSVGTFSRG